MLSEVKRSKATQTTATGSRWLSCMNFRAFLGFAPCTQRGKLLRAGEPETDGSPSLQTFPFESKKLLKCSEVLCAPLTPAPQHPARRASQSRVFRRHWLDIMLSVETGQETEKQLPYKVTVLLPSSLRIRRSDGAHYSPLTLHQWRPAARTSRLWTNSLGAAGCTTHRSFIGQIFVWNHGSIWKAYSKYPCLFPHPQMNS